MRSTFDENIDRIREMWDHCGSSKIAKELGIPQTTVSLYAKRAGLRRYSARERRLMQADPRMGTGRGIIESGGYFIYSSVEHYGSHPLAIKGQVHVHRVVLWNKLKCTSLDCQHPCDLCGIILDGWRRGITQGIYVDHIDRNTKNNDPDNLRPLCYSCNWNRDNPKSNI